MSQQNSNSTHFLGNLELEDLVVPAAVLIGGAVIGRVFGFRFFLRGAMAALALAAAVKNAGRVDESALDPTRTEPRRKPVARGTVKRNARKEYEYKLSAQSAEVAAPAA